MEARPTGCLEASVRAELHRVLHSTRFDVSERNRRFLEYVVEETLAGRAAWLKAYNIATAVFGRPDSFDAQMDPIVRMEARRVRRAMDRFYLIEGVGPSGIRIAMPKGTYVPAFHSVDYSISAAESAQGRPALSITVESFGAEGDPWAIEFNRGFTQQIIVALHRSGECVVCAADIAHCAPERGGELTVGGLDHTTLTGQMAVFGDSFNVTALLVDSSTGRVIWGEKFDRQIPAGLILTVRNEVAEKIAKVLHEFLTERAKCAGTQPSVRPLETQRTSPPSELRELLRRSANTSRDKWANSADGRVIVGEDEIAHDVHVALANIRDGQARN